MSSACRVLLHLVDANNEDVAAAYRTVRDELEAYGAGLADKPEVIALNKCDTLDEELIDALAAELEAEVRRASPSRSPGATGAGDGCRCSTPCSRHIAPGDVEARGRRVVAALSGHPPASAGGVVTAAALAQVGARSAPSPSPAAPASSARICCASRWRRAMMCAR